MKTVAWLWRGEKGNVRPRPPLADGIVPAAAARDRAHHWSDPGRRLVGVHRDWLGDHALERARCRGIRAARHGIGRRRAHVCREH